MLLCSVNTEIIEDNKDNKDNKDNEIIKFNEIIKDKKEKML